MTETVQTTKKEPKVPEVFSIEMNLEDFGTLVKFFSENLDLHDKLEAIYLDSVSYAPHPQDEKRRKKLHRFYLQLQSVLQKTNDAVRLTYIFEELKLAGFEE